LILGKQLGFQQNTNTDTDESTIPLTNGHVPNTSYDNNSSPSLFSTLTALFQVRHKPPVSYKKHVNGIINQDTDNLIYHQLDVPTIHDENNNKQQNNDANQNSIVIHIPPDHSNDLSNNTDNKQTIFLTFQDNFRWIIFITLIYFLWFIFIAGISIVHVLLYSALLLLYLISDRTRRFGLAILIYLTYLLLYDALHLIPNYTISNIHIEDIYLIEKKFFGIYKKGHLLTLNEYFQQNHVPLLDVFTGLSYLQW
jgi:hypothetical protein